MINRNRAASCPNESGLSGIKSKIIFSAALLLAATASCSAKAEPLAKSTNGTAGQAGNVSPGVKAVELQTNGAGSATTQQTSGAAGKQGVPASPATQSSDSGSTGSMAATGSGTNIGRQGDSAQTASPADAKTLMAVPLSLTPPPAVNDNGPVQKKKIVFKPGEPLTITTQNENIKVTNDAKLARDQVANFPDSPEAHFVLAVALTRTSQVEEALKEIRVARKLSTQKGGAAYFDQMIDEYENMLGYYPNDNEVRYHLAWAYYMKAYVLARYSKGVIQNGASLPSSSGAQTAGAAPSDGAQSADSQSVQPKAGLLSPEERAWQKEWVNQSAIAKAGSSHPGDAETGEGTSHPEAASSTAAPPAVATVDPTAKQDASKNQTPEKSLLDNPLGKAISNLGPVTAMDYAMSNAAPQVIPQIQSYYRRSLKKLDEVLEHEPDDLWANLYRAHLRAEFTGDIDSAMVVWEKCRDGHPNSPAPYFFLGEGYLKKGDLRQCLTNVSKAIALRALGN